MKRNWFQSLWSGNRKPRRKPAARRPQLELLEARLTPALANPDLAVVLSHAPEPVAAGQLEIFTIKVTFNQNGSRTTSVDKLHFDDVVSDKLDHPQLIVAGQTFNLAPDSNGHAVVDVTLPTPLSSANTHLSAVVQGTVQAGAQGEVANTIFVTGSNSGTPLTELTLDNNQDSDKATVHNLGSNHEIDKAAIHKKKAVNLSVALTNDTAGDIATPGTTVHYQLTVTNLSSHDLEGVAITDILLAADLARFSSFTWTASATPHSSVAAANGTGNINTTANLAAGGVITFTITAAINADATGTITSSATITPPHDFANQNPNNATNILMLVPQGDLSITQSDDTLG